MTGRRRRSDTKRKPDPGGPDDLLPRVAQRRELTCQDSLAWTTSCACGVQFLAAASFEGG